MKVKEKGRKERGRGEEREREVEGRFKWGNTRKAREISLPDFDQH